MNLKIERETALKVRGQNVTFQEFEYSPEGDFVKVCTDDHELGVEAEYVWFQNKYPGASCLKQRFRKIELNGAAINCDILTIKTADFQSKTLYFDISQLMADLARIAGGGTGD
jgi:hypothetical protein